MNIFESIISFLKKNTLIVSVALTVFGYFLGGFCSKYYYAQSQRDARRLANITRSRPIPFVWKFPVVIEDGSNMQKIGAPRRYHSAFGCPFSFFISQDGNINLRLVWLRALSEHS